MAMVESADPDGVLPDQRQLVTQAQIEARIQVCIQANTRLSQ